MKHFIFCFITFLIFGSCGIHKLEKKGVYTEILPSQFKIYAQDSSVNIIDVRTKKEYAKSHIEGAVNASYFSGNFVGLVKAMNLDTTVSVLIYCETQHRSLFVAKKLHKLGFNRIIDLDKGMMHWRKENFPSIKENP